MKIRFLLTHPFAVFKGGSYSVISNIISQLSEKNEIKQLDFLAEKVDFDVLIIFNFTHYEVDVLEAYKKHGVKIIVYPIFDRDSPIWKMKLLSRLYFPVYNEFINRKRILEIADRIIVANEAEKFDINYIYGASKEKIVKINYAISDDFFEKVESIDKNLFLTKYKIENFVFYPAAYITKRKNQLTLIKALKGSGIKLVLNNTDSIQDGLEEEFNNLTKNDKNIICLGNLSREELISCYKSAKVSVSVSQAETAGLVNLEAAYLGCNLVVSDLPAFREYLKDYPIAYVNQNDPKEIRQAIEKAMNQKYDPSIKQFIEKNYRWKSYAESIETEILNLINYED